MAFCINCGAPVDGKFCGRCGTAAGGGPSPAGSSSGFQTAPPAGTAAIPEEAAGALCYLLGVITGVLFLAMEPYSRNPNIRFHAWQSIFLFGGMMVLYVAEIFLAYLMPGFLMVLLWIGSLFLSLGVIALWLYLMWKTYNKQKVVLPVIGEMAMRQAG